MLTIYGGIYATTYCDPPTKIIENENEVFQNAVGESFLEHLHSKTDALTAFSWPKSKRVNVMPGKSISSADIKNSVQKSTTKANTDGWQSIPNTSTSSINPREEWMLFWKRKLSETSEDSNKLTYSESDNAACYKSGNIITRRKIFARCDYRDSRKRDYRQCHEYLR